MQRMNWQRLFKLRTADTEFSPMMNIGDAQVDMEQETIHYHGWSIALTKGQGIPDYVDAPSEQYDSIVCMIRAVLAEGKHRPR